MPRQHHAENRRPRAQRHSSRRISRWAGVQLRGRTKGGQRRWRALVRVVGGLRTLGNWPTEREAAKAHDRAVLFYGADDPLNFPTLAGCLQPADAVSLRRESQRLRAKTSRFHGVDWAKASRCWRAHLSVDGTVRHIGLFDREVDAALAVDRILSHFGGASARRNFPDRPVRPMSLEAVRSLGKRRGRTSRFRGVCRSEHCVARPWTAQLRVQGRIKSLGNWPTQLAAALAHDRAVLFYGEDRGWLNFPFRAKTLRPASAVDLRAECEVLRKATTTSRFRGVHLPKPKWGRARWRACINCDGRVRHLGLFDDEERAAEAYDRAAKKAFGRRAKLNFPSGGP